MYISGKTVIIAAVWLLSHFCHHHLNVYRINRTIERKAEAKSLRRLRWVKCEYGYLLDGMTYRSTQTTNPLYTVGDGHQLEGVQNETLVEVLLPLTLKEYNEIRKSNDYKGIHPRFMYFDVDKRDIPTLKFAK